MYVTHHLHAVMGVHTHCSAAGSLSLLAHLLLFAGRISTARSAEFLLPSAVSQLVLQGVELGAADDKVFNRNNSGQRSGTIGHLTGDIITRSGYYEHAFVMALIPFMNPELYPELN